MIQISIACTTVLTRLGALPLHQYEKICYKHKNRLSDEAIHLISRSLDISGHEPFQQGHQYSAD